MGLMSRQLHAKPRTKGIGNGKRKIRFRDKNKSEAGNYFSSTRVSSTDKSTIKTIRRRGGNKTSMLKSVAFANILTKDGYKKVRIKTVVESNSNRNFARQNIITKGTVISTELGNAVVTNRPGREGSVNAKIVSN
jgi:small subunit ribosomal protein S8e